MRRLILIALALGTATMLVACGGGSSSGLTGKTWHLTAITEKVPAFQGVIPAADQSKYAITFNTDGTFNATADCNQVSGSYKTSGSNGLDDLPRAPRRSRSAARPRSDSSTSRDSARRRATPSPAAI